MKLYHDRKIEKRDFKVGDLVLLFNSRFNLFLGKLKLKWSTLLKVTKMFPSKVVELENKDGKWFKMNGQ